MGVGTAKRKWRCGNGDAEMEMRKWRCRSVQVRSVGVGAGQPVLLEAMNVELAQ